MIYTDETIYIEAQAWHNCTFIRCQIIYTGVRKDVIAVGCDFQSCMWIFDGPAQNTINFMRSLGALGGEGERLVGLMIKEIVGA